MIKKHPKNLPGLSSNNKILLYKYKRKHKKQRDKVKFIKISGNTDRQTNKKKERDLS